MLSTKQNVKSKTSGFTLIESLVALGIFTSVILIAVTIFVTVSGVQRRVASNQRIQDDMRQVFEAVAQQVRLGSVHYMYYMDPNLDGAVCSGGLPGQCFIDLHPTAASPVTRLALIDQAGDFIYFNHDTSGPRGILQYCKIPIDCVPGATCNPSTNCTWLDITPSEVDITTLNFMIMPSADPFAGQAAGYNCGATLSCDAAFAGSPPYHYGSHRCPLGFGTPCVYYTDGGNYQPKVRIVVEARGTSGKVKEQGHIQLETIISTRSIEAQVLNDYGDFPL